MIEIWINGERAVTDERTVVAYNLQNNDFLKSISDVQVSYTNSFKLPLQPNINLFDQLGIAGNQSTKPYEELTVRIVDGGIELFNDGKGILRKVADDYVEMNVIFEAGLFNAIKGSSIKDLDWSSYNQIRAEGIIQAANSNSSYGYRYFTNLIFTEGKTTVDMIDMLPSLREDVIFDEIISQAGFTKSWTDENQTDIGSNYCLPSEGVDQNFSYSDEIVNNFDSGETAVTFDKNLSYASVEGGTSVMSANVTIFSTSINLDAFLDEFFFINAIIKNTKFTALAVEEDGTGTDIGTNEPIYIRRKITIEGEDFYLDDPANISGNDLLTIQTTLATDAEVDFAESVQKNLKGYDDIINISLSATIYVNDSNSNFDDGDNIVGEITYQATTKHIELSGAINSGIDHSDLLPDIDQAEFLKDSLARYGCSIKKEKLSDTVTIKRLENILTDKANAIDWSDKVIRKIAEDHQASQFGQESDFEYADDQEGGTLLIDNNNLENNKDVFTSVFGGSLAADEIAIYSEEIGDYGEIDSKDKSKISAKIGGNVSGSGTTDLYVYGIDRGTNINVKELNELDLQDNIDTHYPTVKSMIERMRAMEYRLKFSKEDIYNFDPFKLVYLRQEGAAFYVLKIRNIIKGIGTATLIKVP